MPNKGPILSDSPPVQEPQHPPHSWSGQRSLLECLSQDAIVKCHFLFLTAYISWNFFSYFICEYLCEHTEKEF